MAGQPQTLFTVLIFATVVLTALAIGLMSSPADLRRAYRRPGFLSVILVNLVVVPLIGFVATRLISLSPAEEIGVLLCAACAGGPLALKASQISRSDLSWVLALSVALLVLNAAALPIWSSTLLGLTVGIQPRDLVPALILVIMVPVGVGMWLFQIRPTMRPLWPERVTMVSNVLFVLAVAVGVFGSLDSLLTALSSGVLVAATLVFAIGGLAGRLIPDEVTRSRGSSMVTLNRATSVALLVVARAFPGDHEVLTTVVAFGVAQTLAAFGLSLYWRWVSPGSPAPIPDPGITG